MNGLNQDLAKKFHNFLDNKQYERLLFEAEMLGNIEEQDPLVIFYYASAIYLKETSKEKDLLYASSLFKKVHLTSNNHLQSLYNMIAVSFKTRVFNSVLPLALKAYELNNNDVKLIEGLARIHFYLGNRKESIKLFRKLYEVLPEKLEGRLPFISSFNYSSGISQEEYLKECLNYTSLIERKINISKEKFEFKKNKNDKIKLAFLSGDLKTHSVSHFLFDILNKIDKKTFDINLISNLKTIEQDSMSNQLKKLVNNWYDVEEYSDEYLTKFLRSLNLDILIDLSGFTHGNRFEVLLKRCAKIQIEWLGYNNSLGIKNLDYLISDKNLIKPDELHLYQEKILFLPNIWNALAPPKNLPEIKKNLKDSSEFVFCSFNNFQKLSETTINVWSKILKNSDAKILLKNSLIGGEDLKNNILSKFLKNGVSEKQLIFLEREKNIYDHLNLYNKANVALDTFPYPGVTTSFEAILMGLPVLTMRGFNFNSRCGESIMKSMDMLEMIANDEIDYFNKAISIVNDKDSIKVNRINLRERTLSSPLFDTDTFTSDFCNLIKHVHENT